MCLVAFALDAHPRHAVVLAGNRDEVFARPAAPLAAWADGSGVVAGRDLSAGGTWLGATPDGRWAVLTNVRDPRHPRPAVRSRGVLVADFLRSDLGPGAYAEAVHAARDDFDGFNLVVGRGAEAFVTSTRMDDVTALGPGVYGLSNDRLDTPWPKVQKARRLLRDALAEDPVDPERLFDVLDDIDPAPDADLPDTGVGLRLERALSSVRIAPTTVPHGGAYGTRVSTVLRWDRDATGSLEERTWTPAGAVAEQVRITLG